MLKVISGGQTGADQAALRAALDAGLTVGGWAPPDGCSEAGPIPHEFGLQPTPSERSDFAPEIPRSQRTEWNVRDADAVLILTLTPDQLDRGTEYAAKCAQQLGKSLLICDPHDKASQQKILNWLKESACQTLSIGGPSDSMAPGIGDIVYDLLFRVFRVVSR